MRAWIAKTIDGLSSFFQKSRASKLVVVLIIWVLVFSLLDWLLDGGILNRFLFPEHSTSYGTKPNWNSTLQLLIFALGLPVALLLWYWRDKNVQDQIENHRKDINLKEFIDVQSRVAGAFKDPISDKAQETLQLAGLFQLADFLKGEKGKEFARPALETFKAKLELDFETVGGNQFISEHNELHEQYNKATSNSEHNLDSSRGDFMRLFHEARQLRKKYQDAQSTRSNSDFFRDNSTPILESPRLSVLNLSFMTIVEVSQHIEISNSKLVSTILSQCTLNGKIIQSNLVGMLLNDCAFNSMEFIGSDMDAIYIRRSQFVNCNFQSAKMRAIMFDSSSSHSHTFEDCNFSHADLSFNHFRGFDFSDCNFVGARLIGCDFDNAMFEGVDLSQADLRGAHLTRIDPSILKSCEGMKFDKTTSFHPPVESGPLTWTSAEMRAMRQPWIEKGAVFEEEVS